MLRPSGEGPDGCASLTGINITLPPAMPCLPEGSLPPCPPTTRPGPGRWVLAVVGAAAGTLAMLAALGSLSLGEPRPASPAILSAELRLPAPALSSSPNPAATIPRTPIAQPARADDSRAAPRPVLQAPIAAPRPQAPAMAESAATSPDTSTAGPADTTGQSGATGQQAAPGGEATGAAGNTQPGAGTARPLEALCPYQPRPAFPHDALREGVYAGRVVLRLILDESGRVSSSEVLEASPRGYFEAASQAAVLRWQCLPPARSGERSLRAPILFAAD